METSKCTEETEIEHININNPEAKKLIKCLRMSFIFPIVIIAAFCVADLIVQYNHYISSDALEKDNLFFWCLKLEQIKTILGYFSVSLITMAIFMFIQQYYFKIFAGLDDEKALLLLIVSIIYVISYVTYITALTNSHSFTIIEFILTISFSSCIWRTLSSNVRNLPTSSQNTGDASAFIKPNI